MFAVRFDKIGRLVKDATFFMLLIQLIPDMLEFLLNLKEEIESIALNTVSRILSIKQTPVRTKTKVVAWRITLWQIPITPTFLLYSIQHESNIFEIYIYFPFP